MASSVIALNRAVDRFVRRRRSEVKADVVRTVRLRCPVDTGQLRRTIRRGRGDVLVTVTDKVWFYNELGVNNPGNYLNRFWLTRALRLALGRHGIAIGKLLPLGAAR